MYDLPHNHMIYATLMLSTADIPQASKNAIHASNLKHWCAINLINKEDSQLSNSLFLTKSIHKEDSQHEFFIRMQQTPKYKCLQNISSNYFWQLIL